MSAPVSNHQFDAEAAKAQAKKNIDDFFDTIETPLETATTAVASFALDALEKSDKPVLPKNVITMTKPFVGTAAKAAVHSSRQVSAHTSANLSIELYPVRCSKKNPLKNNSPRF